MTKIDKSQLKHGEPERIRSEPYRRFVAAQPCLVCGRDDVQAAHESYGNYTGASKAGDDLCMPLCLGCHPEHDTNIWHFWVMHPEAMMELIKEALRARYAAWVADGRPKP